MRCSKSGCHGSEPISFKVVLLGLLHIGVVVVSTLIYIFWIGKGLLSDLSWTEFLFYSWFWVFAIASSLISVVFFLLGFFFYVLEEMHKVKDARVPTGVVPVASELVRIGSKSMLARFMLAGLVFSCFIFSAYYYVYIYTPSGLFRVPASIAFAGLVQFALLFAFLSWLGYVFLQEIGAFDIESAEAED